MVYHETNAPPLSVCSIVMCSELPSAWKRKNTEGTELLFKKKKKQTKKEKQLKTYMFSQQDSHDQGHRTFER